MTFVSLSCGFVDGFLPCATRLGRTDVRAAFALSFGSLFLRACSITSPANVVEFWSHRSAGNSPDLPDAEDHLSTPRDDNTKAQVIGEPIRTIAVLGAGTMGHGIAQVAAAAGFCVVLRDVSEELVAKGLG